MAPKTPPQEFLSGSPTPNFTGFQKSPFIAKRAPGTGDTGFPLGKIWVDKLSGDAYILVTTAGGVATWTLSGAGSGGPLNTLSDDASVVVNPVANNIQIAGTASQLTTTAGVGVVTLSIPAAFIAPGSIASTTTLAAGSTLSSVGATTLATTGASVNTFGNATGATSVTLTSGSGGIALVATNAALSLASGTGAMSLSADAAATTLALGTGAGAKTVTLGSTNTTSTTTIQAGSGGLVFAISGAITINSGTGTIGISTDATNTTVNIATGAGGMVISEIILL